MARLIDADALKAEFPVIGEFEKDLWHSATIRAAIQNAPTVDAVEVVHGRWIESEPGCRLCSHCLADVAIYSGHRNYCPNCGAKMDGEREDK